MQYLQWIPVSCRKPDAELAEQISNYPYDTYVEVIGFIKDAELPTALGYDGRGFFWIDPHEDDEGDREYFRATHWMPLPPPPHECMIRVDFGSFEPDLEMFETIFLSEV